MVYEKVRGWTSGRSLTGAFGESYLPLPWQRKRLALLDCDLSPDSFPPQLSRDWPKGRFIWFTADRQCRIFVNFIDHMKLVITQPGGDLQKAFRQYSKLLSAIEGCLIRKGNKFMWSSKYGFLTSSSHDVGTGLEVQVKARVSKAYKGENYVQQTMDYKAQPRSQGDLLQYSKGEQAPFLVESLRNIILCAIKVM